MKHIILLITVLLSSISFAFSQQVGASISWDAADYSFGDVPEQGGKVTHKYNFTNTGNEPLVITDVRPSCGCTSSDYTKEPVMPGGKGYVSASFDPNRRVGMNSKTINVTTNCNPPTTTLRFTVNVLAKPATIEDEYPRTIGELRLKTNHLALMKVSTSEIKEAEIEIVNTTANNLIVTFRNVPEYIQIVAVPETLKPNMKGVIKVKYNAKLKNDYGFIMDRITIAINGNTDQNKNALSISATIEEDFSKLTSTELANAPKITFDNTVFEFGTINQGESANHVFKFTNTGKSDLIIRKVKPACGCTVVNPSKEVLKPNETAELKVTFNSAGKTNQQNKTITLVTNDPKDSQLVLRVSGFVKGAAQ